MKMNLFRMIAVSLLLFGLSACSDSKTEENKDATVKETNEQETKTTETANNKEPVWTLTEIADSGIPMLNILILTDETGKQEQMNYEGEAPYDMLGKKVKVDFTEDISNAVMDITLAGTSIIGDWGGINQNKGTVNPDWKTAQGVLLATEVADADSPVQFSVKSDKGTLNFEYFVTEKMTAQNGNEVTVYYIENKKKIAKSISPAE